MARPPQLLVGTSGWSYDHWRGRFYPEHLPATKRLGYYAEHFGTVEVNATFYGLPKTTTVESWRTAVPEGFVFAVKGSRYVTHMLRLANAEEALERFIERIGPLGPTQGPLLWQLPPFLERDVELLGGFLRILPSALRHAVEFRHASWLQDDVFELLRGHNVAMVNASGDWLRAEFTPTADFAYARFHGTTRYHGAYNHQQLRPWADFLGAQLSAGRDCYAYFNNDAEGHAPADALRLMGMLEGHTTKGRV